MPRSHDKLISTDTAPQGSSCRRMTPSQRRSRATLVPALASHSLESRVGRQFSLMARSGSRNQGSVLYPAVSGLPQDTFRQAGADLWVMQRPYRHSSVPSRPRGWNFSGLFTVWPSPRWWNSDKSQVPSFRAWPVSLPLCLSGLYTRCPSAEWLDPKRKAEP